MKSYSQIKYIFGCFFIYLLLAHSFLAGCNTQKNAPAGRTVIGQALSNSSQEIDCTDCSTNTLVYNTPKNTLCSIKRSGNKYSLKTWCPESKWTTQVESWKIKKNQRLDHFSYNKTGSLFACLKTYKQKKLIKQDVVQLHKNGKIQSLSLIGVNHTQLHKKSGPLAEIADLQACDTSLAITYQYGRVKIYNIAERRALGATNITGSTNHNIFHNLHYLTIYKNNSSQELLLNNYDIRSGEIGYSFPLGGNGQDSSSFHICNYQNTLYLITPKGVYTGKCDDTILTEIMDYKKLLLPEKHCITYWQAGRDNTFYLGYKTSDKTFHLRYGHFN